MTLFEPVEFFRNRPNLKTLLELSREETEVTVYFDPDDGRYYARGHWHSNADRNELMVGLLPCRNDEEIQIWMANVRKNYPGQDLK